MASGRFRMLVLVLAYCGLRFGEAAALQRKNVDLDTARIWVTASASGVTGRGIVDSRTKSALQFCADGHPLGRQPQQAPAGPVPCGGSASRFRVAPCSR